MSTVPINKGQFTLETAQRAAEFERRRGDGVEAAYKANREAWRGYAERQFVSDYPLHVDLELASICNLRCPMCYTISDGFRARVNAKLMDYSLFTKCVDECAANDVYSIRLSLRGESFLHPRIVDCVKYAKDKGIKEVSTLTNGGRLDRAMFTALMDAGLDWITISIDGVGEVYEKIRDPIKFDDMVRKLGEFREIKEAAGRVKPVVKVQTVLPAIEKNPGEYYDIFAPITDMVSANPLIDFHQSKAELPKIADFSCPQVYQRLVVGADGLCMLCANDERGEYIIGNANKETIHEIWHGEKMTEARRLHRSHQACGKLKPCSECYLPIAVQSDAVSVGDRTVVAENYVSGNQRFQDLNTPERWKREDLDA